MKLLLLLLLLLGIHCGLQDLTEDVRHQGERDILLRQAIGKFR